MKLIEQEAIDKLNDEINLDPSYIRDGIVD